MKTHFHKRAVFTLFVLLAASLLWAQPMVETGTAFPLETKVVGISKYGNLDLAFSPDKVLESGYEAGDLVILKIGSYTTVCPFGTSYSDVDTGNPVLLNRKGSMSAAINMGNLAKASGAEIGTPVSIALSRKGGYLLEYNIRQLNKSEKRSDYASDEIFANFRKVRMGRMADNRYYRSCNPALGDARAPYADKLAKSVNIRTVINLADSEKSVREHLDTAPFYTTLLESGSVITLDMGVDFSDPAFHAKLREGLLFLADHPGPYLIHCNEGKDRAGVVSVLLEALEGASLKQIQEDYMLSFKNYFKVKPGTEQYKLIAQTPMDELKQMNGGEPVTDKNAQEVARRYILETIGLTEPQLEKLISALE